MNDNTMRDALYDAVYEEMVGPRDPLSKETLKRGNPKSLFSAGVLFPMGSEFEETPDDEGSTDTSALSNLDDAGKMEERALASGSLSDEEEPIALSNSEHQSAISMTVAVVPKSPLTIEVQAGRYDKISGDKKDTYKRAPIIWESGIIAAPSAFEGSSEIAIPDTNLVALLVYRYTVDKLDVITIALRNKKKVVNARTCDVSMCYFQSHFSVKSESGFRPLPSNESATSATSAEELSNRLIYSKIKNFAIGHGCATDWSAEEPFPKSVETRTMPMAEVMPTMSSIEELSDVSFDMFMLSDPRRWEEASQSISALCDAYDNWIDDIDSQASDFEGWKRKAAAANIAECKVCLSRIKSGLDMLESDAKARTAFHLANEAMLSQYLHYSVVANECDVIREPQEGIRSWRPFQIAFLLMNVKSMIDDDSPERNMLDLIWFPTGGGKTEAYLGLSAFTLILERLNGESCYGSTILMRYTLRLLSSQQFARASSLICALEVMRRDKPELLGDKEFSIGFWVGSGAAPNNWTEAMRIFSNLKNGKSQNESLPVTQCPWCGHAMGEYGEGYKRVRNRNPKRDAEHYLKFVCPNSECDFGTKEAALPLKVVDDEIYLEPPSLLLGTVDKFAMVTYRPQSFAIFGINEKGEHVHAPKLIIQDELHLISGPLGSMVAHYETLIDALCTTQDSSGPKKPKIIASTATVSRAKEQCHELFAVPEAGVRQFPPSGISYDDSFFSRLDRSDSGRRYVGIYTPGQSLATTSIKLYAQLLWEPKRWNVADETERDPYWTVVGYYGSTRELGQALTWTNSDIPERLYEKRRLEATIEPRYLRTVVELTGRKDAPEVKRGLEQLTLKIGEKGAIDLCLATNMISVGLDVPRLGTMVVAGQPKETAEYIQATSRVGRGENKGIVFVVYGTTRPRDRSHYESFRNYHESFYQHVEPSSVTAFCNQVRSRAMAGTLFGLYRSASPSLQNPSSPDMKKVESAKSLIGARIDRVDAEEREASLKQIDEIVEEWNSQDYSRWECLSPEPMREVDEPLPLMHPRGGKTNPAWGTLSFEVPTSMRSVDEECQVSIIGRYPASVGEEE